MEPKTGHVKRATRLRLRRRGSSLREQLKEKLLEKILTGEFAPGSTLGEKDLAAHFGVSKTPVREALGVLAHEGLVQVLPRKGYLVTPITVQDVHEYFGLRVILECAAAELAATNMSGLELGRLEELARGGNDEERKQKMLDRNFLFHQIVARASGNMRLARLIEQLLKEMRRLISVGFVPGEHEKLLVALQAREPIRAWEAMRNHIITVRDNALRMAQYGGRDDGRRSAPRRAQRSDTE